MNPQPDLFTPLTNPAAHGATDGIADATEVMARNYNSLLSDKAMYERWYNESQQRNKKLRFQNAAYRAWITRLKKKLSASSAVLTLLCFSVVNYVRGHHWPFIPESTCFIARFQLAESIITKRYGNKAVGVFRKAVYA